MTALDIMISILIGTVMMELIIRGLGNLEEYYEERKLKKGKKE